MAAKKKTETEKKAAKKNEKKDEFVTNFYEEKTEETAKTAKKKAKMSGLDAAAKVLTEAGEAMRCGQIVERMLAKKYWKTNGKTPAATIYSAMLREINTKGKNARFKKTDRGLFAANK